MLTKYTNIHSLAICVSLGQHCCPTVTPNKTIEIEWYGIFLGGRGCYIYAWFSNHKTIILSFLVKYCQLHLTGKVGKFKAFKLQLLRVQWMLENGKTETEKISRYFSFWEMFEVSVIWIHITIQIYLISTFLNSLSSPVFPLWNDWNSCLIP